MYDGSALGTSLDSVRVELSCKKLLCFFWGPIGGGVSNIISILGRPQTHALSTLLFEQCQEKIWRFKTWLENHTKSIWIVEMVAKKWREKTMPTSVTEWEQKKTWVIWTVEPICDYSLLRRRPSNNKLLMLLLLLF